MTTRRVHPALRAIAMAVLALGIVAWSTAIVGAVAVVRAGAIAVNVKEKAPGGDHVRLFVPAILVNASLWFASWVAPDDIWGDAREELVRWRPVAERLAHELDRCPEGVLVEVRDGEEHVTVELRGGALYVSVESPAESVDVRMPMSVMRAAAGVLPRS